MINIDCIFCKIVSGEIPCHKIYEDENVLAFLDIFPANPGHSLVIPKSHTPNFEDIEKEKYLDLMDKTQKIAKRLKEVYKTKKISLTVLGFDVDHTHIHLVPLNEVGAVNIISSKEEPNHLKLAETAKKLKI